MIAVAVGERLCLAGAAEIMVASGGLVEIMSYILEPRDVRDASQRLPVICPAWDASVCLTALRQDSGTPHSSSSSSSSPSKADTVSNDVPSVAARLGDAHPDCVIIVLWGVDEPVSGLDGYSFAGSDLEERVARDVGVAGLRILYQQTAPAVPGSATGSGPAASGRGRPPPPPTSRPCVAVRRPLRLPRRWAALLQALCRDDAADPTSGPDDAPAVEAAGHTAPCTVLVTGAKAVGKSTFCRALVNALLSRGVAADDSALIDKVSARRPRRCGAVAFLDLDVGQPELGPPGVVSLHVVTSPLLGPPHTHQQHPVMYGD